MNRVLATALEYLNYIIVLVIIAAGGYAGWLLFQGDPEPQQNAGVVSGVVLGVLVAALVGGAMALVVLMEQRGASAPVRYAPTSAGQNRFHVPGPHLPQHRFRPSTRFARATR